MPADSFNLKTEYNSFSKVLVVDEAGELSTLLIDALLNHGCLVNYFGKEPKESFYYLLGKNNFVYLDSFEKEKFLEKIDYFFYFPSEHFSKLEIASLFTNDSLVKSLICAPLPFSKKDKLTGLVKEPGVNIRAAYFDCVFGPRIKLGFPGQLFSSMIKENSVMVSGNPSEEIYPVYAKELVKELIRLIFSIDTERKEYFLQPRENSTFLTFASLIKANLPEVTFSFSGKVQDKKIEVKGMEKIEISYNLEEKIQETIDWFKRSVPIIPKEVVVKEDNEEQIVSQSAKIEEVSQEKVQEELRPEVQPVSLPQYQKAPHFKEGMDGSPLEAFGTGFRTINQRNPAKGGESSPEEEKKTDFLFPPQENQGKKPFAKKTSLAKKIIFGLCLFLLLFFLFFIVPIGLSAGASSLGIKKAIHVKEEVEKGNFTLAIKEAEEARGLFAFSKKTMTVCGPFYGLVGFGRQMELINEAFPFLENLINSLKFSLLAASQSADIEKSFFDGEETKWPEISRSINSNISSAYEQASLAQTSLDKIEPVFKFFKQAPNFEKVKLVLPQAREILLKGKNLIAILPKILGVGGVKTYLVLLQNNMEIRPTGGFIGSYGIVRLENGKLINFEVFDVYQADGQLKGHVEPPVKLKEHLGEATWYLRDSNWDPDFPISAKRAGWFLDKEMQVSTDGTIAINLEVVKKLLGALGEVEVPEYREKVNANNLFQKAEYYSELGTFPGSTQKKDFLASLTKVILERVKQAKTKQVVNVAGAIFSSLEQKEMMLYFDDPEIENSIADLEWEGSIRNYQPSLANDSIFTDYLFLAEANVGINKANYFTQRKIDHQITINEAGKVQEKLTIAYENLSPSENWPAGRYKNYLRLYLKKGANLNSVFINDPSNPGLWLPFDSKLMDLAEEHGKTVYGFLFEVPIKTQRKIEMTYELPESIDLSTKLTSYLLMTQKQSGAFTSNYDLTISYPGSFVPLRVIPSAVVGNQQLLISTKFNKDLVYQIDLAH